LDFSLTQEQQKLRESVLEFAGKELTGSVLKRDRAGQFSHAEWKKCAEFGIHGLPFEKDFGGSDFDPLSAMLAMESLGYACKDNGLLFAINAQMWSVQAPIAKFGTDEQKQKYLPPLIGGEIIGAHGMTEPGSGSDTFALSTLAEKDGEDYILSGSKIFTTSAPVADLFIVFATVNKARGFMGITAFLVDKGTPGLSVGETTDKMGLKTSPMGEVVLSNCRVSASQRLGREGNGGTIFNHSMAWERSCILASCIGTMQRQVEQCADYAKTRQQFKQPISNFQAVSHRIVDMKVRLEAARNLLYKAGWLKAKGEDASQAVAMAKLFISESFVQSSLDSIQIHGGYGYTTEMEIERDLRDAVATRIYSGTSEIQKEIIARAMGL